MIGSARCSYYLPTVLALACLSCGLPLRAATFTIPDGDAAALKAALSTAGANGQADTISLAPGGTYTLTEADNVRSGPNGLPVIEADGGNPLTIEGNGATIARSTAPGTADFRLLFLRYGAFASISGLTLRNGYTTDWGGCINNEAALVLERCALLGSASDNGGALMNFSPSLRLTSCVVSGNRALFGGGISNYATLDITGSTLSNNASTYSGGGINNSYRAVLRATGCTFSGNQTGGGGGLYNLSSTATLSQCTLSGNKATGSGGGLVSLGGVIDGAPAPSVISLRGCTVTLNESAIGAGLHNQRNTSQSTLSVRNSIVAGNIAGADLASDGTIETSSYNKIGGSAGLGPLADNGGPTLTHALLPFSLALNAGDPTVPVALENSPTGFDQRGAAFPRLRGGRLDIGAFEAQNEPPVVSGFSRAGDEDAALSLLPLAEADGAFADANGDRPSRLKITRLPASGTLRLGGLPVALNQEISLSASGSAFAPLTYTPPTDFSGSDSVGFTLADALSYASAPASLAITIRPVNDPPSFGVGAGVAVAEDSGAYSQPQVTGIAPGPANESAQSVAFTVTSNNPALFATAPSIAADGRLSFVPAPDASGSATVTVVARDSGGVERGGADTSLPQSFFVTVEPVNDAPLAQSQSVQVLEDTPLDITLGASDADSVALSYSVLSAPAHGTLSGALGAGGAALRYIPNADFNGADSFTFRASDGAADSAVATVSITVRGSNDAPNAQPDSGVTREDAPLALPVLANDRDIDGDTLRVIRVATTRATHGTVRINPDGTLLFVPAPDFNGVSVFSYALWDGALESSATVTVQVLAANDAPVAQADSYLSTGRQLAVPSSGGLLRNDSDVDGDALQAQLVRAPRLGTLRLSASGAFVYAPSAAYAGRDSFFYAASDGARRSAPVEVSILSAAGPDRTPPTVAIAGGAGPLSLPRLGAIGGLASDPFVVRGAGVASSGLKSVEVRLRRFDGLFWNGRGWQKLPFALRTALGVRSAWQLAAPLPSPSLAPDGRYLWSATATDNAGRSASATQTLIVDSTPPQALLDSPAVGSDGLAHLPSLSLVSGRAVGAVRVEVALRNGAGLYWNGRSYQSASFFALAALSASRWSLNRGLPSGTSLPAGRYTLQARAVDAAGNSATATRPLLVSSSSSA